MIYPLRIRYLRLAALLPLMFAFAAVSAQDGRVALGSLKASAEEVMHAIETQSNYRFAYNQNDLDTDKVYDFPHTDLSIKEALGIIMKGAGLGYVIRNGHIAFVPASPAPAAQAVSAAQAPSASAARNGQNAAPEKQRRNPDEEEMDISWLERAGEVVLLFRFDSSVIDGRFRDNAKSLEILHDILTDPGLSARLDSIVVKANSSPEGSPWYNKALARRRTESVKSYILKKYPHIDESIIKAYAQEEGYWDRLVKIVAEDPGIPGHGELQALIDDPNLSDAAKSRKLNSMQGGRTFAYLRDNLILQNIRMAIISFIYTEPEPELMPVSEPEFVAVIVPVPELPAPAVLYTVATPVAMRTNLLLDIAGGANIGVEIPIGNHFSVAGDFAYAHTRINNRYALQTMQGTLEGRYWFRPRRNSLTGWNLGVYGTYSDRFDIQWGGGVQGDGYWSGGLSGGYSFPLSKSFNLDLSIMGGFVYSPEVREYGRPQEGHLMWERTRYNVSRVFPAMVRVNLVWLINKKVAK